MVDSLRLYGQAMLDYLGGGSGRFAFERDDGYRDESSVDVLFAGHRGWPDHERVAIR